MNETSPVVSPLRIPSVFQSSLQTAAPSAAANDMMDPLITHSVPHSVASAWRRPGTEEADATASQLTVQLMRFLTLVKFDVVSLVIWRQPHLPPERFRFA